MLSNNQNAFLEKSRDNTYLKEISADDLGRITYRWRGYTTSDIQNVYACDIITNSSIQICTRIIEFNY